MKYKIGIVGSYGGLNLGDEAILQCLLKELHREFSQLEVIVFTRDAEDTLQRHQVDRAVPVRKLSRSDVREEVERLNLLIIGGGGILFDSEARIFLREAELAIQAGIPIVTYAIGAGPLNNQEDARAVRSILNRSHLITVRESKAQKILEDIGLKNDILVTADPALLMEPEPLPPGTLEREHLIGDRPIIGMSVREPGAAAPGIDEESYHSLLANAADYMVDRYQADIIFIPMERKQQDLQHSHAVISKMLRPQHTSVLRGEYTSGQVLNIMNYLSFAVGMRLHFLIFAALRGVPFVALPYAGKVEGFLEMFDLDMPPIELVNAGRLIAHIDHWWDLRDQQREKILRFLPRAKERARQTAGLVANILRAHQQYQRLQVEEAQLIPDPV